MADSDVKIQISTEADVSGADEVEARLKKLREEEKKKPGSEPRAPEARPDARPTPQPSWPKRDGNFQLATDANPRKPAEAPTHNFRKLTDEERKANRERIAAEDEAVRVAKAEQEQRKEKAREARERSAAEKAVTREMREQQALRRAGITQAVGTVQAGAQIAGGGGGLGMIGGLAALANPVAIGAAIIGGATLGIAKLMASEKQKDTLMDIGVKRDSFNRSYQLNRAAGIFGSSGELVSSALAGDEEISKRKADRSLLDEKARVKWHDPSSWTWGGLRKNSAQREAEENESQIADLEKQKEKAIAAAQRKFMEEEGGMRLRALRARSKRTLAGSREAFLEEIGQEWMNTYKEALKASGSESVAKEMADLTVGNKVRDMQASAGAGLVDSKSGGAEMAAAAQWAMRVFPDVGSKLDTLNATVQAQANQIEDQSKK